MFTLDSALESPSDEDDSLLLLRLRSGDGQAFGELVRSTGGRMLAVARSMLGHDEDADDAVQDAYLSAFRSLDRFDGRSRLSTWLHRITVNACLMRLRSQRRRPDGSWRRRQCSDPDLHTTRDVASAHRPDPSVHLQRRELCALVQTRIDELPGEHREVLYLRDVLQLDTSAAADALNISVPGVKTRLHRARRALKSRLENGPPTS